ncbi:MAG: hypothetical protein II487_02425, partial [Schwartzia sp.]|nr:hypothetical protein [Schwartzia sp. (in: firmicutes)]
KTKQKEESEPINGADVKSEYDKNATPGKGKITFDKRFKDKKYAENHQNEIDFANWLYEYYGGDIHLLGESTDQGVKSPDYLWNNRFWDLKNISTEKAANSAVRKGVKQIVNNPGGIMLDFGTIDFSVNLLKKIIDERMKWYKGYQVDIMVISKKQVLKIFRYKK